MPYKVSLNDMVVLLHSSIAFYKVEVKDTSNVSMHFKEH